MSFRKLKTVHTCKFIGGLADGKILVNALNSFDNSLCVSSYNYIQYECELSTGLEVNISNCDYKNEVYTLRELIYYEAVYTYYKSIGTKSEDTDIEKLNII